jgi:hypothetical protein
MRLSLRYALPPPAVTTVTAVQDPGPILHLESCGPAFYLPGSRKVVVCGQAKFDELYFPFRKQEIIDPDKEDHLTNILSRVSPGSKWVPYDKSLPSNLYEKVHYDRQSDTLILRLTTEQNTYAKTTQMQYFTDILSVQTAFVASLVRTVEGLPPGIDPDRPPKNYKEAMARPDREKWAAAYQKEFQGFKDRNALAVVKLPEGAKALGTTTRLEYKINNGVLEKYKVRMCVREDQQREGVDFNTSDLYSPVLKATEARLLTAIAAEGPYPILKTDMRQAFLYGDMGKDKVYIRPPDWWPEPIPEGHVFLLLKSIYGTKQAARRWHLCISEWMEKNGYPAVNSEKTIFMKRDGDDFIIHGLFVDDMMHIPTCERLKTEFLEKYTKDFDITGGGLMETFLGMQVEQSKKAISLHLDNYIRELLDEYKAYATKSLRPKLTPIQPGLVLSQEDCPIVPDARKQKFY